MIFFSLIMVLLQSNRFQSVESSSKILLHSAIRFLMHGRVSKRLVLLFGANRLNRDLILYLIDND